jgi:trk system potassium uptake protein TrkA
MRKQMVVIGLGRFGTSLATTLYGMGYEVLAIDNDERRVQNISSQVTRAIQADATNEIALDELGVGNFDAAAVAIGYDLLNSILVTALLKKLGVRYIVARAKDDLHGRILKQVGANFVVYPESELGSRVAHGIDIPEVLDYIPLTPKYGVTKISAPPHLVGITLRDAGFGQAGKSELVVLLIHRGKEILLAPGRSETIKEGDILIIAGTDQSLEDIIAKPLEKH